MELQDLRYAQDGHIATITLDRPTSSNAYSMEMIASIERAFDQAQHDPEVRVVILTGSGKSFSAGGDVKAMRDKSGMFEGGPGALRNRYLADIHRVPKRLDRFDKPVVAAINGHAIGAGLDLTCMCDIRIAARGARFGSTFVKLGLVPGDGGAFLLSRVVGFPKALELMLTGRLMDCDEAEQMGLLHAVTEPEALMERARDKARQIAGNAPMAVQLTRRACYAAQHMTLDQALEAAATYQGIAQNTSDHAEGVEAMVAKRPPRFEGR